MQFYALDGNEFIVASSAKRHKDYHCPECNSILRLRGGPHRQNHFYHPFAPPSCRQHQKSLTHLQVQWVIKNLLPAGESALERPFPSINRIADVAWETQKIIFEVQCSPISILEAAQRTHDYNSLGWTTVWLLHAKRYNKRHLSGAEIHLRKNHCYFTNIDENGNGIIYDQNEVIRFGKRVWRGPPIPIDILKPLKPKTPKPARTLKSIYMEIFQFVLESFAK